MTAETVERARGQIRAARKAPPAPSWRPPVLADFLRGQRVLVFDATLSHCGWALLEVLDRVVVHGKGTISPVTSQVGYLGTWDKARMLQERLAPILRWAAYDFGPGMPRTKTVVEAPSVGGGSRTESSLIAGMLVWMTSPEDCAAVSATHVSAVLLGDSRVRSTERKKRIREAVIALVLEAAGRNWNEHERDALATGLTHLYDIRQGSETGELA
ncbi:MAG: hypothetical protein JWM19_862 [Actinomycetia bacterium]|nr:hypothetical protein [Actinomycetes bacterium]